MQLQRRKKKFKQMYKCYTREIEKYQHFYTVVLSKREVRKVITIIKEKFKPKFKKVTFNWDAQYFGGRARKSGEIQFAKNGRLNLLLVCHEMAHLIGYKWGLKGHSNGFYKMLGEVIKYVEDKLEFKIVTKGR